MQLPKLNEDGEITRVGQQIKSNGRLMPSSHAAEDGISHELTSPSLFNTMVLSAIVSYCINLYPIGNR